MPRLLPVFGLLAAISAVIGCSPATAPSTALTVFGAASLTGALTDLSSAWQADYPDSVLETSTGSSAALRAQIEQGAPADVFMSADTANPQALIDDGLAEAPLTLFATNSLTVIVPADNPAGVRSAADLAAPGVCVIAAGPDVPITKYAEQVVARLAALPGYGTAFADGYAANVCSREDNVAAVVSKVELGEGDAAIVYGSDARADPRLGVIALPAAANVVAVYGAVRVNATDAPSGAAAFLDWLLSDAAQRVLAEHGFGAAP